MIISSGFKNTSVKFLKLRGRGLIENLMIGFEVMVEDCIGAYYEYEIQFRVALVIDLEFH